MEQHNIDPQRAKIQIKRRFGCGTSLFGKPSLLDRKAAFREEILAKHGLDGDETSEVKYLFFTLFYLPIYPLGCYRILNRISREYEYKLPIYNIVTNHTVAGEENSDWKEILHIYLHYWILIPAIIALFVVYLIVFKTEE